MYVNSIYLKNYKNYKEENVSFNKYVNIIYGDNAQGKTNLIESIYLLSYGRTFKGPINSNIINFENEDTYLKVDFFKNERDQNIAFYYNKNDNKKYFKLNEVAQNKLSDLYGKINIVVYKPEDIDIIKKGPSVRRRYIDMLISSIKPMYISLLSNYNTILKQRNYFLKNNKDLYFKDRNKIDRNYLEVLNTKLVEYANKIFIYRKQIIEEINKIANEFHIKIVKQKNENLSFKYKSSAENKEKLMILLNKSEYNDFLKGYTSHGIHRDDIIIKINELDITQFGSQGQQKSSILSLKLAESKIIEIETGEKPIILLDDFMSELDKTRQKLFIENIKNYQLLITSTNKIILDDRETKYIHIKNGKVIDIEENN